MRAGKQKSGKPRVRKNCSADQPKLRTILSSLLRVTAVPCPQCCLPCAHNNSLHLAAVRGLYGQGTTRRTECDRKQGYKSCQKYLRGKTVPGTHLCSSQQLLGPRCTGPLGQAMQHKQTPRVCRVEEVESDRNWVLGGYRSDNRGDAAMRPKIYTWYIFLSVFAIGCWSILDQVIF